MSDEKPVGSVAGDLLAKARARLKKQDYAVAAISDPEGLLNLADETRQRVDARINDFGGRVLLGLEDPRWHDVARQRNAPQVEIETAREIVIALRDRHPKPADAEAAGTRLRKLLEARTEIVRQFKP